MDLMSKFPAVIAHRGACRIAPENTLPAFQKAIEMGCDSIEVDVHMSKDGHVIVIHDSTLNRTTDGDGLVVDHTLAGLKKLDAGKHFSKEFIGTTIPALEEVFQLVIPSNIQLIIELKGNYTDLEHKVAALIRKFKYEHKAVISSSNLSYLRNVKRLHPHISIQADIFWTFENIVDYAKRLKVDIVCPIHFFVSQLSQTHIKKLKANNIKLYTFTIDSEERMICMIKKKVDGIMTNRPDILIALKADYKTKTSWCIPETLASLFHK
jgi:glycerophosphoryl diester phosphodiesterase